MKSRFAWTAARTLACTVAIFAGSQYSLATDDPKPAGTPAPAPSATPAAAPAAAPADSSLPEAKVILEKYVEVIGGRDRLQKIKSRVMTTTIEFAEQGLKGTAHVYQAPPALALSETEISGIGKFAQGSDGEIAWESNSMMGPRILTGKERANYLRGMRFNAEYDFAENYKSMKTIGVDKVGEKPVYIVELISKDDVKEKRLFDKETGLLLSLQSKIPSQMGEIESETFFSDYRDVDGVKIPFKQSVKVMNSEISTKVEKAEFDVVIPPEKFTPPDDVKALIEKQKAAPAPSTAPAATPAPEEKK